MKPTLFLLAAGMGSRYGGLKQLDGLGPNGETIMDYSIYDAIQAGFGKIVWVIRKDFEEQFRTQILAKYEDKIPCELCFQSIDAFPEGFSCPEGRVKPWGTNHAVLMGKDVIKEPFCVINCDDFYNRDAFMVIGKFLSELPEGATEPVCHGGIPRGQHAERERNGGSRHLLEGRAGLSDHGGGAHRDCALCRGRLQCRRCDRAHPLQGRGRTLGGSGRQYARFDEHVGLHPRLLRPFGGLLQGIPLRPEEHGEPEGRILHSPDGEQADC